MNLALLLLFLRIISALLLLAFLGLIAWLTYRDLLATERAASGGKESYGYLRLTNPDEAEKSGRSAGARFPLQRVNSIGRADTNSVLLDDGFISSEHALLTLRGQRWWLEDLNSRNGTLLNGVRLTEATVVSAGDVIGIGDSRLLLEPAHGHD